MIKLKNINIKFNKKECIRNGDFQAYNGQITGIYGESGTGKSSLLYILGMLSNQQHEYYYNNQKLVLNDKEKAEFRNQHISVITQSSQLIETISVEKNIEFYLKQSNINYTINELLEMIHLKDKINAMPSSLSGGERQRVAIACAIAKDSDIVLADEPTSALDQDNKDMVMELLRKCALQGKTVIIVSHEKNVIEECDRVYKLDHLELTLEKEIENQEIEIKKKEKKKIKALEMFELLFYSNRKNNRRRILISFIILIPLFLGISIFVQDKEDLSIDHYSVDDITQNKLLVYSDETGDYHMTKSGFALHTTEYCQPLKSSHINKINKINSVRKSYDYYTLNYAMLNQYGRDNTMTIKVKRNNTVIEKRKPTDEDIISYSREGYPFSVIPFYPEEKGFKRNEGVYVNTNMAYNYNIKVGDTLELELNVPYAVAKSVQEEVFSMDEEEVGNTYYPTSCIGELVKYKTKVIGIVEANSIAYNEVYLQNDIMQDMLDKQIQRYKNNEIKIDKKAYEGYSTIEDLKPYAKTVFVDKVDNVLKVQNDINEISDKIFAYNEYQSILELKEESDKLINDAVKISYLIVGVFIISGAIIEVLYLRSHKSTYMMMRFLGIDKKKIKKVYMIHEVWQIMIMLCISVIVYITASIPKILISCQLADEMELYTRLPDFYLYYMDYGKFSFLHFVLLILIIVIVISGVHLFKTYRYDKNDIIKWLREK
jgi:ABC-type antimicrobial peptide transport system, ATPase component